MHAGCWARIMYCGFVLWDIPAGLVMVVSLVLLPDMLCTVVAGSTCYSLQHSTTRAAAGCCSLSWNVGTSRCLRYRYGAPCLLVCVYRSL